MMQRSTLALLFLGLAAAWSPLSGQSATAFARMNQDVQLLNERVQKLSLAVDVMQRENEELRRTLEAQVKTQNALLARFEAYSASIDARLESQTARDNALKKEILTEVSAQIKKLASEMQDALNALSKAQSIAPQIETPVNFPQDYPTEGVAYEVQPGDTLSGIAKKFNSNVRDIQNANHIANPSQLQAGRTIFVPQR